MLGMDDDLQHQMGIYMKMIRPQFAQPGEQKLFAKDDGAGIPEGTIGKRVTVFFRRVPCQKLELPIPILANSSPLGPTNMAMLKKVRKSRKSWVMVKQPRSDPKSGRTALEQPHKPWRL